MSTKKRYPPMYNYCDYRCEQCWYPWYKNHCPTYKNDKKRRLQHQLAGKDPDDMKVVLEDVKENFEETIKLIYKGAKKWGIDLNNLPPVKLPPKPKPKEMVIYRSAYRYFKLVRNFLEEWEVRDDPVKEKLKPAIDNISWYHTLIPAKLYRALTSLWESQFEDKDSKEISLEDAFFSAQITLRSINISIKAWKNIYQITNDDSVIKYLELLKKLSMAIKRKFKIRKILTPEELYHRLKRFFNIND